MSKILFAVVDPYKANKLRQLLPEDGYLIIAYGERLDPKERFSNLLMSRWHPADQPIISNESWTRWQQTLQSVCSERVVVF